MQSQPASILPPCPSAQPGYERKTYWYNPTIYYLDLNRWPKICWGSWLCSTQPGVLKNLLKKHAKMTNQSGTLLSKSDCPINGRSDKTILSTRKRLDKTVSRIFWLVTLVPVGLIFAITFALAIRSLPILQSHSLIELFTGTIGNPLAANLVFCLLSAEPSG